jgi:hypothetical protein
MVITLTKLFPHKEITPLPMDCKPTFQDNKLLKQEINANVMAVPCDHGGTQHSHVGIIMLPADYQNLVGIPWDALVHPGPAPIIPVGATSPQISQII